MGRLKARFPTPTHDQAADPDGCSRAQGLNRRPHHGQALSVSAHFSQLRGGDVSAYETSPVHSGERWTQRDKPILSPLGR